VQNTLPQTPSLMTALTGPLHLLEKQILNKKDEIESWFQSQWKNTPAPVYGSVDLRNSGFKLVPVDMNLFPAGFNNLNPDFLSLSVDASRAAILDAMPSAKRVMLIPENHTRNLYYWANVKGLINTLTKAGFDVRVGTLLPEFNEPGQIDLPTGEFVTLETIKRDGNTLVLNDFIPDVLLLNNDLSDGIPAVLQNVQQPLIPPAELGWSLRSKSEHFQHYAAVCDEFAKFLAIDPWFIAPLFRRCDDIDFMKNDGEDCLATYVGKLLEAIQKKYDEYEITCKPYVVVKADAGTYGIAVMMVKSVEELRSLNRKQRVSMSKSKGGQAVTSVIVQEGVYTFETWGPDNAVAEPVVYMWGQRVVGGFYRVHKDRGIDENLNSPGMHFEPLAFAKSCHEPVQNEQCNRFYAYGVIARLSMLAAAREMREFRQGAV
jgi:glutamate--cysteine ligase